jgi:hypothetical protein
MITPLCSPSSGFREKVNVMGYVKEGWAWNIRPYITKYVGLRTPIYVSIFRE